MNIYVEPEFPASSEIKKKLSALGHTLLDESCLPENIQFYAGSQVFTRYPIEQLTSLKVVQLASAGYDRFNLDEIKQHNIKLTNARNVYSIPIAEFTLARLLEVNKQLRDIQADQSTKTWLKRNVLVEFTGQSALILGTGSIGSEIAKRLKAFDVYVDGANSNGRAIDGYRQCYSLTELTDIIGQYDYIINALPLNDHTFHCLNQTIFEKVKDDAVLVNIGRGPTIDEQALTEILDVKFRAVILDVFEQEPLVDSSLLWSHPKAYISSHTSFGSGLYLKRLEDIVIHNVNALNHKIELINIII